jgi:hypothetical protein
MYNCASHNQGARKMKFLRPFLLCALVSFAGAVGAADEQFGFWTINPSRSGYWVGAADYYASNITALLKYDNDDGLVFAKPYGPAQGFNDTAFYNIVPLNDGGAIVIGESYSAFDGTVPGYSLHRVDATGAPVWSLSGLSATDYPVDNFQTTGTVLLGVDNSGAVWFPANGHIYRVDATGALVDFGQLNMSLSNGEYAAAVDPVSGTLYFLTTDDTNVLAPQQLLRYTPGGVKSALWSAPDAATKLQFLTLGSDGNLYAIGNSASTHLAMSFGPSGNVRWSKTFGSSLYTFSTSSTVATQAAAFPDGSIVALDTSGALVDITTAGQVTQIPDSAYLGSQYGDITVALSSQGDILLYDGQLLRVTTTGQVIANVTTSGMPALLADGTMIDTQFVPNGTIYLGHLDRYGNAIKPPFDLVASLAAPAQTRVDQIGLDGAWYASAESGQGFTIDYVAASNVLFIPWFTYSVNPTSDMSGLAWVTFQGSPTPGATSATLQIARTEPGVFNTGTVPADVVGTAVLTATDCLNARLQYQFDDGVFGGIGGYIPLVRLSPSTTPCIGANGQTTPPQNTNAPLHGFDANQSGSWFDPSTSGQGIELTIIPAGTGYNGLVFGAWFTFDVPPANDAMHEQWFTLQGDMSSALNGTVTLPIVQNVGGSLDSLPSTSYSEVGTVTLSMLSCTTATLVYQFDNSTAAGHFAGLSGTINLIKIGGCVTP